MGDDFDLCGALRRIRRLADLSQRELAARAAVSASAVGHAEAGTRDLPVASPARAAAVAGLHCAARWRRSRGERYAELRPRPWPPIQPTSTPSPARALVALRTPLRPSPAVLHVRPVPGGAGGGRGVDGRPADHHEHRPGDSFAERAEARRRAYWQHRAEERERAFLAGELRGLDVPFLCACPAACDDLDDRSGGGRSTRRNAPVTATWPDRCYRCPARQPLVYQPRRGPLLGRPPRRGDRASPGAS